MIETTIKIPQHLIYFFNVIKNFESNFGKNDSTSGMSTGEILILLEIYNNEGYVNGMKFEVMELGEADESGRRKPVPTGEFVDLDVDTVVVALGTGPNPTIQGSMLKDNMDLETDRKGYIIINAETGETSIDGVYAGGDAVTGAATVILAMGAGRRVAAAIDACIQEKNK